MPTLHADHSTFGRRDNALPVVRCGCRKRLVAKRSTEFQLRMHVELHRSVHPRNAVRGGGRRSARCRPEQDPGEFQLERQGPARLGNMEDRRLADRPACPEHGLCFSRIGSQHCCCATRNRPPRRCRHTHPDGQERTPKSHVAEPGDPGRHGRVRSKRAPKYALHREGSCQRCDGRWGRQSGKGVRRDTSGKARCGTERRISISWAKVANCHGAYSSSWKPRMA